MHLNSLYGMFGRKLNTLKTIAVKSNELNNIMNKFPIKTLIELNDDLILALIHYNLDYNLINKLKVELSPDFYNHIQQLIKSNIAIASAITASIKDK